MMEDAAVMPTAKSASKPSSVMALISMAPRPAQSATAAPDMPANSILESTFTWPKLPVMWPTQSLAKRKMRFVMPLLFISSPTSMKNGMASMV